MKCPKPDCHKPLVVLGSAVTDDQTQLRTTYLCPSCFNRITLLTPNPRYVPLTAAQIQSRERERLMEEKRQQQRIARWHKFQERQQQTEPALNVQPS